MSAVQFIPQFILTQHIKQSVTKSVDFFSLMAIKQLFLALCLISVEVTSSPLKKETSSIGFILGGSWYKTQSIGELKRDILFVNSMII